MCILFIQYLLFNSFISFFAAYTDMYMHITMQNALFYFFISLNVLIMSISLHICRHVINLLDTSINNISYEQNRKNGTQMWSCVSKHICTPPATSPPGYHPINIKIIIVQLQHSWEGMIGRLSRNVKLKYCKTTFILICKIV